MNWLTAMAITLATLPLAAAQQSESFQLEGGVVNAGGRPSAGATAVSARFHVTLDAIGEAAAAPAVDGGGVLSDTGFTSGYRPPGEATQLRFTTKTDLAWSGDRSATNYRLYRELLSGLPSLSYGACLQTDLPSPAAFDPDLPVPGTGFFYLATIANRLDEEGTKGSASDGTIRAGTACP